MKNYFYTFKLPSFHFETLTFFVRGIFKQIRMEMSDMDESNRVTIQGVLLFFR